MYGSSRKKLVVLSVGVTLLAASACRRSSEERRATDEAEERASQTTLTSGELTNEEGLREQAEAITATRSEQLEYRAKLQHALDELDVKRREAKKRGHVYVKATDARREVLRADLDALERTPDTEWAPLKAKIDRDLAEGK